jgi:hypothetical protein
MMLRKPVDLDVLLDNIARHGSGVAWTCEHGTDGALDSRRKGW